MINTIYSGVLIGLGATIAMDAWAFIQNRIWGVPMPNWAMPGRWFAHLFRGKIFHHDIGQSDEVPSELIVGWLFHYGVGVVYGIVFLLIVGTTWQTAPDFLTAWVFAIATIAAGWFILQPGMGLGWAASKTPTPWKSRGLGLIAHTVFGLGIWGSGVLIGSTI
ncbi:DUF2938 domain-containing protein [Celeribacter sp.]|uniref:DUF2938 domain-containing protein n=1 Tax=Celeribacter sp. TaxID=1890673 RepID=UPI003A91047D